MRGRHSIEMSKEEKEEMIAKLQTYFLRERDEELGNLAASLMVDFIIEGMGAYFYNKGLDDAMRYINDRVEEIQDFKKY